MAESSGKGICRRTFGVGKGQEREEGVIPIAVRNPGDHEFVYRPGGKATKVFVAGSFNGWSKEATPMMADEKGAFRAAVALKPGSYSYKFVVDGEWTPDKENPKQEPDGFGGMNSLLAIAAVGQTSDGLSIFAATPGEGARLL